MAYWVRIWYVLTVVMAYWVRIWYALSRQIIDQSGYVLLTVDFFDSECPNRLLAIEICTFSVPLISSVGFVAGVGNQNTIVCYILALP